LTGTKQDFMALAGRSPKCASVLTNPERTKFTLLNLGSAHTEAETISACDIGCTEHAGVVAQLPDGSLDFVALPDYELLVMRALVQFGRELAAREVLALEKWFTLEDTRPN
jgi:hypothetical protein